MVTDPINDHPPWARVLVAVSVGYFAADGVDMLWNQTLAQAWDLLCHHLAVVSCLSTAVVSGHYVGFSMVSLLLELNSICLHLRKLLLLSHKAPSLAFRVSSWASLATLVLFRLLPLGWMSLWLSRQHYQLSLALVLLCVAGLVTVGSISISTGIRILTKDILQSQPYPFILMHKETKTREPVARNTSTLSLKGSRYLYSTAAAALGGHLMVLASPKRCMTPSVLGLQERRLEPGKVAHADNASTWE